MPLLVAEEAVPLWPLALYFAAVMVLAGGILGLSYVLGERHRERATDMPYESGEIATGSARVRMPVEFYLVALFFVIFDLEAVFLFAWAVAARQLGWAGYIEVVVFVLLLVSALVYLWRQGALDWGSPGRRVSKTRSGSSHAH